MQHSAVNLYVAFLISFAVLHCTVRMFYRTLSLKPVHTAGN